MCTAIVAVGLFMQQGFGGGMQVGGNSQIEQLENLARNDASKQLVEKANLRKAELEETQFVQRFNELVVAMGQFSKKYKSGHVIDVKAVQSIKKAYRNLEKADPWFKNAE